MSTDRHQLLDELGIESEPNPPRAALDSSMRAVLVQLAMCSHISATSYQPRGRSGATDSVDLSGGDTGRQTDYARWYGPPFHEPTPRHPGAKNDTERAQLVAEAQDDLKHLRGTAIVERPPGETVAQRDARLLKDYEGETPEDVAATREGVTAAHMRKIRVRAGRDQERGKPLPPRRLPAAERKSQARVLHDRRVPISEIARRLGVDRVTIKRDLGRNGRS